MSKITHVRFGSIAFETYHSAIHPFHDAALPGTEGL